MSTSAQREMAARKWEENKQGRGSKCVCVCVPKVTQNKLFMDIAGS